MTARKFTDDEIIKALELCAKLDHSFEECDKCPYKGECDTKDGNMPADALALINCQKAEIENLNIELQAMRGAANSYKMRYETARAEAIKEFAERAKEKMNNLARMEYGSDEIYFLVGKSFIDNLVKEILEENK